jgi:hypothetical protein|tara:strand:+ start:835 stop:1011 length:177 start_codon:yes stop_codon:yes gene_type:complete
MKIRRWIAELFGLQDAYSRLIVLEVMVQNQEREIAEMKREINGLKMESDILYAKSIKK